MKERLALAHIFPRLALWLACMVVAGAPGLAQAQRSREPVTLNFVNAEIEAVARTMASITGRNIVVDPRVKGTINLSTDKPVPPSVAYNQFLAAVRLSGFTIVESGGLLKLVPEADAKLQGGAVSSTPIAGNQIVTQIFRLNYEPAGNLVPILRPLISANNTINVNPGNNSLVITDYADNLQRLGRIIAALDVTNATDVEVIPLRYQLAPDIAPVVQRLLDSSTQGNAAPAQGQADTSFRTTIVAETRSNALLIRAANPARLALVRSIVAKLDQPGSQSPTGNIYVVYLKNADATKLAVTLRAALAATGGGSGGGGSVSSSAPSAPGTAAANAATTPIAASAQPSTGGQIQADPSTNSLIITAAEPQYRQIRAVIDRLDSRRAQVYVEGLVVEVNATKVAEFGIQWQGPVNSTNNTTVGVLGTNFTAGTSNILSLATAASSGTLTSPGAGINFATATKVAGRYLLSSLAHFLQTNGDGNVLSTPNLLTLDNEEAKIVVGQNVPFVTGQYTNANSGTNGSVNPFQTIERKDVGLTLRIKPQISENGTVKLQIFQEVSSVDQSSRTSASGLITNKSSIESNVLVDDGAIVVLGGLLKDSYSEGKDQVPVLGDVPFFGNLFKSQQRNREKTNLMVFLRPVVVRDAAQSEALSLDRYDMMRAVTEQAQPTRSLITPINDSPALAPIAPGAQPRGSVPAPLGR
ncbi:type II secretion system protein GspD [Caenimonas koreensis DSM 17982]|uniref:Type II secretion system protein GspD n=2 Tax=Caenimonas TaxID=763439 RepID=A0A844B6V8_9BURK|nr:type II secretion system protein GspD [Caenimonas koreensis DSM 17982]